nr:type I polyketide synthase [Streptomyces sp. LBUM 1477]
MRRGSRDEGRRGRRGGRAAAADRRAGGPLGRHGRRGRADGPAARGSRHVLAGGGRPRRGAVPGDGPGAAGDAAVGGDHRGRAGGAAVRYADGPRLRSGPAPGGSRVARRTGRGGRGRLPAARRCARAGGVLAGAPRRRRRDPAGPGGPLAGLHAVPARRRAPLRRLPGRHRRVRRGLLPDHPARGRGDGPAAADPAGGGPRDARSCRRPGRVPLGQRHRCLRRGLRVRLRAAHRRRSGRRRPLGAGRRGAERDGGAAGVRPGHARAEHGRRHRLFVVAGGRAPRLCQPAHGRERPRDRRRGQPGALPGRHGRVPAGGRPRTRRAVQAVLGGRRRDRPGRGVRGRPAETALRRRAGRRPDPRRRAGHRRQLRRPFGRPPGPQPGRPTGPADHRLRPGRPLPAHMDHVEAHGTGTPLGDPIEAGALGAVLGRGRDPDQPLLLGSVKGNLGHLESAAGMAGLVKTVLALHHDLIPPTLHCAGGSSLEDGTPLRVVTEAEPWPRYGGTATAGVSGFGFGGTNAHAVLEEWPPDAALPPPAQEPAARLHLLSDAGPARVRDTAARLADWLDTPEGRAAHPGDVARTLAGRAGRGRVRAAVVAGAPAELADGLRALAGGQPHAQVVVGDGDRLGPGPVWVFSGYGSQWPGMGRRLLAEEPAFAAAVEKLDAQLAPECGFSLYDQLATGGGLDRLEIAQPVLFGLQLALAELWRAHGAEPAAVIGHSLGEVAAAVCAGALEVADGARVVAVRARLLGRLRGGAMAVVDLADDELDALARDFPDVHVAVHSSPGQKVVTGREEQVARLVSRLEAEGRAARAMRVVGAGHSPQVEPLLPELTAELADVRGGPAHVPVYSTVLDDPRGHGVFDAAHWAANLRRPVRLDRAVAAAAADGHTAFVELSPHPVLTRAITDTAPGSLALGTLRRDADSAAGFLTQVGVLHTAGLRLPVPRAASSTCPDPAGGTRGTGGPTGRRAVRRRSRPPPGPWTPGPPPGITWRRGRRRGGRRTVPRSPTGSATTSPPSPDTPRRASPRPPASPNWAWTP